MAKDKKTDKGLLPKSIAGTKLPKDVRKKLLDLAQHPVVADLIAAGLVALAAKLKKEPGAKAAADTVRDKAVSVVQEVAKAATDAAAAVVKPAATPAVKRVRKPAAKPAAATPAATKPADAKPATAAKPRTTRRAAPKAPKTPKTPK